jgi:hypothetical protein
MFEVTLIDIGIAFLLAVTLAEWAKVKRKFEKGFGWLAAAGVFFLFAGTINATTLPNFYTYIEAFSVNTIFAVLGWILALIGTVFILYETLLEK